MNKIVKLEESFINAYVDECLEYKGGISSTRIMRLILDTKYEKANLNKFMAEQYQHLSPKEREILLQLLRKFEDFFDGTLGTCKTAPVEL